MQHCGIYRSLVSRNADVRVFRAVEVQRGDETGVVISFVGRFVALSLGYLDHSLAKLKKRCMRSCKMCETIKIALAR